MRMKGPDNELVHVLRETSYNDGRAFDLHLIFVKYIEEGCEETDEMYDEHILRDR